MIGRSTELDRLRDALRRAVSGLPTTILVAGEAGIGKTRLVREFLTKPASDVRVLQGGCLPIADGLLPYAPVVEMLRGLGRDLLADSGSADQVSDQHRLFESLSRLLEQLAADGPLVVVLEDLHWADPSTQALLTYLVHGMRSGDARVLLLGTYRSDEVSGRHPLRALLAEIDRAGVERIELERLAPVEVAAQITGVCGAVPDDATVERMHARCDGNPFLVEELLAAGPDTDPLPAGTRDILLRRVRRLPEPDQRLLRAVAVAGRSAEHDLLGRVLQLDDDALLDRMHTSVDEQILVSVGDGYAFRHALVAEALLAETLPGERRRWHRAYAEALTGRGHATPAEIAHHWCAAGNVVRGLAACVEAGLAAERLFAQAEARQHFDRAIDLWLREPQARSATTLDLVDLCRRGAEAAYLDGDTDHAIALVRRAIDQGGTADPGMLYERLGRYLWANGNAESDSIGAYRRAVELTPDEPSAQRARALTGLASALVYTDRPDPSAWCTEALRVACAAGDRREEGRALQTLGYCRAMVGDIEDGLAYCREGLAIAAELGHSEDHCRAYVNLVGVLRMAGRIDEAATTGMEGVDHARRHGADRTYGNLLLGDAAEAMILVGRWDEADDLLPDEPDARAHGTPVIATNLWLSAANLHTWRGRFDESQRFLDACLATYAELGHGHVRSMLHGNLSERCIWLGQYAEASRWVGKELDLLGPIEFTSLLSRLVLQGLRAEAGLARPADLHRLLALLEDMSARPDPPPDAAALLPWCWAEVGRVQGANDPDHWGDVVALWTKMDMPWPLAYVQWRHAEALLAHRPGPSQRAAGSAALAEAHAIAARLGAEPMRREILSLARRARITAAVAPSRRPASELTDREQDVLALLCAGATNRRIAQQLFISEKTVSIHVSRILAKLNAATRGEAAAVAQRQGLIRSG